LVRSTMVFLPSSSDMRRTLIWYGAKLDDSEERLGCPGVVGGEKLGMFGTRIVTMGQRISDLGEKYAWSVLVTASWVWGM
jgi:hypothetical protein